MHARLSRTGVVAGFLIVAALCLPLADLTTAGHDPWATLSRMARRRHFSDREKRPGRIDSFESTPP